MFEGHELSIDLMMRLLKDHEDFDEKERLRLKDKVNLNPTMPDEVKNAIRELNRQLYDGKGGLQKQKAVVLKNITQKWYKSHEPDRLEHASLFIPIAKQIF